MTDTTATMSLSRVLETEADLRMVYKQPKRTTLAKNIRHIDRHFQRFIGIVAGVLS